MKNIVVGIDFSQNSENALRHAVALALKTDAKIHIVWVKTPGASSKLGALDEKTLVKTAQDRLEKLLDVSRAEAPENDIQTVFWINGGQE